MTHSESSVGSLVHKRIHSNGKSLSKPALDARKKRCIYDAIKADDASALRDALPGVSPDIMGTYIDAIRLRDEKSTWGTDTPDFNPNSMLHLCIAFRAKEVIKVLIEYGASVHLVDMHGNNILHVMVYSVFWKTSTEEAMCDMFDHVQSLLTMKGLAKCENDEGFRPLELAFHVGVYRLGQQKFFQIPGVHLLSVEHKGIYKIQWYDISEYEGYGSDQGKRRLFSPMHMLSMIEKKKIMTEEEEGRLMDDPIILDWVRRKFKTCIPLLAVWFFIRLVFATCIMLYMRTFPREYYNYKQTINNSNTDLSCLEDGVNYIQYDGEFERILVWTIFGFGCLMVVFDIWETLCYIWNMVRHSWMIKNPDGSRKDFAAKVLTYRLLHFVLATLSICIIADNDIITHIFEVSSTTLMVWSILYMLEILPGIGKYVITFQRLLTDMLYVLILFAIFIIPYAQTFQKLSTFNGQLVQCTEGFRSPAESTYNTFSVMQNMVDFQGMGLVDPKWVFIMHVIFVIIVNIMLLNYFIAVLSESAAQFGSFKDELHHLQKLNMCLLLERRTSWILGCIFGFMQRRIFVHKKKKLYLTRILVDKPDS